MQNPPKVLGSGLSGVNPPREYKENSHSLLSLFHFRKSFPKNFAFPSPL